MATVYLNGTWLPAEQATVSVNDRGFLFGDSVYEVIAVHKSRPILLKSHLTRLFHSAESVGIHLSQHHSLDDLITLCEQCSANNPDLGVEHKIYLQVSRGAEPTRHHTYAENLSPTIYIAAQPCEPFFASMEPGDACLAADFRWQRCDIKSNALIAHVMLSQHAKALGCTEAILTRDGHALEGASSNLFCVHEGQLYTPPADHQILNGTVRRWLLELANELGIAAYVQPISIDFLRQADEVWLSSATRFLQPITNLDGQAIGSTTHPVAERFWAAMAHQAGDAEVLEALDLRLSNAYERQSA